MSTYADDSTAARAALTQARADHEAAMVLVRAAVLRGVAEGVPISNIADDVGVTRATVYAVIQP